MAGIYLHIPFCRTRCVYCDFYSTTLCSEKKELYVHALGNELRMRKSYLNGEPVETIYFGGGTPSLLSAGDISSLINTIEETYGLEVCREITIEANPDDLTPEYVAALSNLPISRLSIGIQTFDDQMLRLLNRRHSSKQAIQAIALCRKLGFENISIDLMYGLPGQTLENWKNDLEQAISLNVEHISAYHLIYEDGTSLWKMKEAKQVAETDDEDSIQFFTTMISMLKEAGYIHYEISNFCKPKMFSYHNSSYWKGIPYLGCGASAHSYDKESRQWNVASIDEYITGIETGHLQPEKEILDIHTKYNDFIITSLRTMWGLSLETLLEQFGEELYKYCMDNAQCYLQNGKMENRDNNLYISDDGIFISDSIMSELLWV